MKKLLIFLLFALKKLITKHKHARKQCWRVETKLKKSKKKRIVVINFFLTKQQKMKNVKQNFTQFYSLSLGSLPVQRFLALLPPFYPLFNSGTNFFLDKMWKKQKQL